MLGKPFHSTRAMRCVIANWLKRIRFRRQFDMAGLHFERAVSLNPNDAVVIALQAHWLARVGRQSEALGCLDLALKHDPFPPSWYFETRAIPLMATRRYKEVVDAISRMSELHPWNHAYLAAAFAHLGEITQAQAEGAEVLRQQPDFTISWLQLQEPFQDRADAEPAIERMRKAGLPQ
jgi:adenylate cyclase